MQLLTAGAIFDRCPCLHLSGTALSLSVVKLHLAVYWRPVWPIEVHFLEGRHIWTCIKKRALLWGHLQPAITTAKRCPRPFLHSNMAAMPLHDEDSMKICRNLLSHGKNDHKLLPIVILALCYCYRQHIEPYWYAIIQIGSFVIWSAGEWHLV
jgi:hypothetical protein